MVNHLFVLLNRVFWLSPAACRERKSAIERQLLVVTQATPNPNLAVKKIPHCQRVSVF